MSDLKTVQLQDALERLTSLIQVIEEVRENTTQPSAHPSLVKRILDFASQLFIPKTSIDQREMHQVLDLVSKAVPFINTLQQGTNDQRALATRAAQVITDYNRLIDTIPKEHPNTKNSDSLTQGLLNRKIELPKPTPAFNQINSLPDGKVSGTVQSLFANRNVFPEDLFRVKAITLLKNTLGMKSAILAVKNTPIQTVWDSKKNMFRAEQTICTFPGEVCVLTALLDHKNGGIPSELDCKFSIHQTGFPASSQYTGGLVFPHELIQESTALPLHEKLQEEKKSIAQALLPEGSKYQKAKEIISLKKEAFLKNREEFLRHHQGYILQLISAAFGRRLNNDEIQIVKDFFKFLGCASQPFEKMHEVSRLINVYVTEDDFSEEKLFSLQTQLTQQTINYILLIIHALAPTMKRISLCEPLTSFDNKVIASAYYQQYQFCRELNHSDSLTLELIAMEMRVYLAHDTLLFLNTEELSVDSRAAGLAEEAVLLIKQNAFQKFPSNVN